MGGERGWQVMAALEAACQSLALTPEAVRDMLQSPERYSPPVLHFIKSKTGCNNEQRIRCGHLG